MRPYRSRKQRPCDACRVRKIGCIKDDKADRCTLCQQRKINCTYQSSPKNKKRRVVRDSTHISETSVESDRLCAARPSRTLQFLGLSGDQDPFVLLHTYSKTYRKDDIEWGRRKVNDDLVMPAEFAEFPDQHLDADPVYYPRDNIEELIGPHGKDISDAYFKVVHASYPILDKGKWINSREHSPLLTASIYALGHKYTSCSSIDPWRFLNFIGKALPLAARNTNLDTIEAALLYSQRHTYLFRAPTMPGLTAEIGSLVGMSYDVGLNVDPTGWNIEQTEKKRRRRLWWAVYTEDKWAALTLGRPSFLVDSQSNVGMLTLDDFTVCEEDINDPLYGKESLAFKAFIAMAKLTTILSDILSSFYTIRAAYALHVSDPINIREMSAGFLDRLALWYRQCGSDLFIRCQNLELDPTCSLRLAYYICTIVIYRAELRFCPASIARSGAKQCVLDFAQFVQCLKSNQLKAFWWAVSKVNFGIAGTFMYSLLLSSLNDDDFNFWVRQIDEYQESLKEKSEKCDVTKLASIRLDILRRFNRDQDNEQAEYSVEAEDGESILLDNYLNFAGPSEFWATINKDPFVGSGNLDSLYEFMEK